MEETNEILIKRCLSGDAKAQKELFDKYAGKMLAVCSRYMQDQDEAEDVFQDGFVKVFSKLNKFNGKGSLEGWIRRIIVNSCLDQIRKNKKFKQNVSMENVSNYVEFDGYIIEQLGEQDLLKIIEGMPDGYRVVFNMFAIEGFSHKEIANELNVSENTSKSQYARARAYLKKKLEEYGIER